MVQKQKSNHIKTVLIAIALGVSLMMLLLALRLRGSVVVRPNRTVPIAGEVTAYWQDDDAALSGSRLLSNRACADAWDW